MKSFPKWIKQMNKGYYLTFVLLILCFILITFVRVSYTTESQSVLKSDTTLNNLSDLLTNLEGARADLNNFVLTAQKRNIEKFQIKHRLIDSLFDETMADSSLSSLRRNEIKLARVIWETFPVNENSDTARKIREDPSLVRNAMVKKRGDISLSFDNAIEMAESVKEAIKMEAKHKYQASNKITNLLDLIGYGVLAVAVFLAVRMLFFYNKERFEKRHARNKANEYYLQLEERIQELTRKNKEIVRLKNLQKYSSLGRIAATFAHGIKNPLTNINLATNEIREESKNGKLDSFVDILNRNSKRINEQINEFLQAARVETPKIQKESINRLLQEVLFEFRDRIQLEKVKVIKKYDVDIGEVSIDAERMKIALGNIVSNAFDAMQGKKKILTVKTETKNDQCVVTIADSGIGMDEKTCANIFEPYFTTKTEHGTGLGLSQAQNIILNNEGDITVESSKKGTNFYITLHFA